MAQGDQSVQVALSMSSSVKYLYGTKWKHSSPGNYYIQTSRAQNSWNKNTNSGSVLLGVIVRGATPTPTSWFLNLYSLGMETQHHIMICDL